MSVDQQTAETAPVQPRTTSLNESDFRADDVAGTPLAATEAALATAPGEGSESGVALDRRPRLAVLRELAAKYQLILPPSYENIVGGAPPSPIVSIFLVIGLAALLGAALLYGLGADTEAWWLGGALFVVIATTLAGFISRTAD